MSIFVNQTFQIELKFTYVLNKEKKVTGVKILAPDAQGESVYTITCDAVGKDFDTMSQILEDATVINHITGKPIVRNRVLCRLIILRFLKNFKDGDQNDIAVTNENIGKIHYEIIRALARSWLNKTSGKVDRE
jgi:hypothetical protein